MLNDLRYALRRLIKEPGFSVAIIITLALGIAATTAVYSAFDGLLLHPYDDPATSRNVSLRSLKTADGSFGGISPADYVDLAEQAKSFETIATWEGGYATLTGEGDALRLRRDAVTAGFFNLFGIKMAIGRTFTAEEYLGNERVIILSYAIWQQVFGGSRDIIGRVIQFDGLSHTVVGIISKSWEGKWSVVNDAWVPWNPTTRPFFGLARQAGDPRATRTGRYTVARLRAGCTLDQADAEMKVIAAGLADKYQATNKGFSVAVASWTDVAMRDVAPGIRFLFVAAACVLLIASVNVANLFLVRSSARQRELCVRAAVGATRWRLVRLLLTESAVYAIASAIAGIILAQWSIDVIARAVPTGAFNVVAAGAGVGRLANLQLNGAVVGFCLFITLGTVAIAGAIPAWLSSAHVNDSLKQGARGNSEGASSGRLRRALVIAEVALALVLLGCGGVFVKSFGRLIRFDPGFTTNHGAFGRMALPRTYANVSARNAFVERLLTKLRNSPGVDGAALAASFPLAGSYGQQGTFRIDGTAVNDAAAPTTYINFVTADFFRVMEIPLRDGRYFADTDDEKAPPVAIVNQTLARRYFPNVNPIGRRISISGANGWREIVGVVGDVGQDRIGEPPVPQTYELMLQRGSGNFVIVRGKEDSRQLLPLMKAAVAATDRDVGISEFSTFEEYMSAKFSSQNIALFLLMSFAAISLVIALVGIYGVIAFSVSQRTTEIGIRMALGAQISDVLALFMTQGAKLIAIGIASGVAGSLVAGHAIQALLYNTGGTDPVSLTIITLVFAAVAILACWIPARRATKVDPIVALRSD